LGVKGLVVLVVSLDCHVVRCAVHETRVGKDSRADDVGLLTFVPCACPCANALLRADWRRGGVDRGRALKTRRANCGVSRFGVSGRRAMNRLTRGLESNGRLVVPPKATADGPQPLRRLHFSSTISIANPDPSRFSHLTFSNQQSPPFCHQGSQHILLLP
jgi:hypothetical protein